MNDAIELAQALIACRSVTPDDAGCQDIIAKRLSKAGFAVEALPFGPVKNLWARYGTAKPLLVFAGHTDVVPPGPIDNWQSDPFHPTLRDGHLYGRGAADMKSSLAAMIVAAKQLVTQHPQLNGSIALLITSDEECTAVDGTKKVVATLASRQDTIDWCVIGEASSHTHLGDAIKIGRRGSLSGELTVTGKQGHIAYPLLADNPIHRALSALDELTQKEWDQGNAEFPATSLQLSNIHAGTGATNVIPGELLVQFNFRYSPAVTAKQLMEKVSSILKKHKLKCNVNWHHSSEPFLTQKKTLINATVAVIKDKLNLTPELSTTGGTSDGRFIAPAGAEVIELGPINATIHQVDECIKVDDIPRLTELYYNIAVRLLV